MKIFKKMSMAGVVLAVSLGSYTTAEALSVGSLTGVVGAYSDTNGVPLGGFVFGSPTDALILPTNELDQTPPNDSSVLSIAHDDGNKVVAYRFANASGPALATRVTFDFHDLPEGPPDNYIVGFDAFWAENADGTGILATLTGSLLGPIAFGQLTAAYLFVTFNSVLPHAGNSEQLVTILFESSLSGGEGMPGAPSVPLPPSMVLFGTGLLGLGFLSARRRKKATSV